MAQDLISHGARVDYAPANMKNYRKPIHFGAFRASPRMIQLLIDNGANWRERDYAGSTPFSLAAGWNKLENVKHLTEGGHATPTSRTNQGDTPLMLAAKHSHTKVMEYILDNFTDQVDLANPDGYTALHLAALRGERRAVEVLLAHNADRTKTTKDGSTAEDLARKNGYNAVADKIRFSK